MKMSLTRPLEPKKSELQNFGMHVQCDYLLIGGVKDHSFLMGELMTSVFITRLLGGGSIRILTLIFGFSEVSIMDKLKLVCGRASYEY